MSHRERERAARIRAFHGKRIGTASTDRQKADAAWNLWRAGVERLPKEEQATERTRMTEHLLARSGDLTRRKT